MADLGRAPDEAVRLWDEWEAEEVPFLLDDRPRERAHLIVGSSASLPHDAEAEVVVSAPQERVEEQVGVQADDQADHHAGRRRGDPMVDEDAHDVPPPGDQ
jgi:hypothetical protein